MADTEPVDYFISHSSTDHRWAVWVAESVRSCGFSVRLDVWDWAPGTDVVQEMERALQHARCVISIWTPSYFVHQYSSLELRAAFARHLQQRGQLLPILVEPCDIPELYGTLMRLDLVGMGEDQARSLLLETLQAVSREGEGAPVPAVGRTGSRVYADYPGRMQIWNIPPQNPNFTGRASLLAELGQAVLTEVPEGGSRICALHGLGGVGKTRLAIEFAYLNSDSYDIGWWIPAEYPANIPTALASLASRLGLSPAQSATASRSAVDSLFGYLRERRRWLLIYDNATMAADLSGFIPPGSGSVVITSRNPVWGSLARRIEVPILSRRESVELLGKRVPAEPEVADQLSDELGDLPLAVQQVSAFLERTALPAGAFLDLLRENRDDVLAKMDPGGEAETIATVWTLSIAAIKSHSGVAVQLLRLASLFGPEAIPLDLLSSEPGQLPQGLRNTLSDPVRMLSMLAIISGFSLGRYRDGHLYLHRLVQAAIRIQMPARLRQACSARVRGILRSVDPGDPNDPPTWEVYNSALPHLLASPAVDLADEPGLRRTVLNGLWALYCQGQDVAVLRLACTIREGWGTRLGAGHPDVLTAVNHQAAATYALGNYQQARALHETALAARRAALGDDHLDTLASVTGLAITMNALGEHRRAVELNSEAFERYQARYGSDHLDTLRSATSLANALTNSGEYDAAAKLHRDTLARRLRLLPEDHPAIFRSMNNLADTLLRAGQLSAAHDMYVRCFDGRRQQLGLVHPDTLNSAWGLAECLLIMGEHEKAHDLHTDTLQKRESVYGRKSAAYVRSLLGVAECLLAKGDLESALESSRAAAEIGSGVLGPAHCLVNRAGVTELSVLLQSGNAKAARRILRERIFPHSESCIGDCQRLRLWMMCQNDRRLKADQRDQ